MEGIYKDKTEYMLTMQKQQVEFKYNQVLSQLYAVRKRMQHLVGDIYIYAGFCLVPLLVTVLSLFILIFGHIALRLVIVPLLVISSAVTIFVGPISSFHLISNILLYLFNRNGGQLELFGHFFNIYTFKAEESYCMGKLAKLKDYQDQIENWLLEEVENPSETELEEYFEKMDLDFTIKVANARDPLLKHMSKIGVLVLYITAFVMLILIWGLDIFAIQSIYQSLNQNLF